MINFKEDENESLLEDYRYAKHRKAYLELMSKFISENINGKEFEKKFVKRWMQDGRQMFDSKEKNVDLERFRGFADIIAMVFLDCQFFEPDESLNSGTTEEELRIYVTEAFLKIKNNYP
jgi:hypothetical protein